MRILVWFSGEHEVFDSSGKDYNGVLFQKRLKINVM